MDFVRASEARKISQRDKFANVQHFLEQIQGFIVDSATEGNDRVYINSRFIRFGTADFNDVAEFLIEAGYKIHVDFDNVSGLPKFDWTDKDERRYVLGEVRQNPDLVDDSDMIISW